MIRSDSGLDATRAADEGWGLRILLAEDDLLLAATVVDFLQDEGFLVTAAPDGAAALRLAQGLDFDLLLTDLRMPGLDGAGLISALRAARPDLPVVVMSGDAAPGWRGRLDALGIGQGVLLVAKPMRLQQLRATLDAALTPPQA